MNTNLVNLEGNEVANDNKFGVEWNLEGNGYKSCVVMSPVNARIQVLTYEIADFDAWLSDLKNLADRNDYGKIWVKARKEDKQKLEQCGMSEEGVIEGYFNGEADAHIMAYYTKSTRRDRPFLDDEENSLKAASSNLTYFDPENPIKLPKGYKTRVFQEGDELLLSKLYAEVFPTYPYPIDDPDYLLETSKTNIIYRLIFNSVGKLVAAASAETVPDYQNAEMTDFATLPSERGKGLAQFLLSHLENDAKEIYDTRCYYTVARIAEPGMVRVFLKNRYQIKGILTNNCSISGQFETMVLLVKE